MKPRQIMPPTYLLIAILSMVILHLILPKIEIIPPLWNLLGILPILAGLTINLIADQAFQKSRTTIRPFEESSVLVTHGIFQISRNPMYLGLALIASGVAVLLGSLAPFLVTLAFAALIDRVFITAEERMLACRFGPSYAMYKEETRRWV